MSERQGQKKSRNRRRTAVRVPPPDSSVWPEQYRGKRWKPLYAILFAGRCQLCAYSCPLPTSRQLTDKWQGETRRLLCTNHPADAGELREVLPVDRCRNFKAQCWKRAKPKAAKSPPDPPAGESDAQVRRIPVGNGLFATVDAADYEELSKYNWRASRQGRNVYATCWTKGRAVYMHRMIMRPRKGYVVDHIDGNGLNNRRCNLRVCTRRQNLANRGPCGGTSRFVGVYRDRSKWAAHIRYRGKRLYIGSFDDEAEAAKARDRKAFELFGEFAYLNFPDELERR